MIKKYLEYITEKYSCNEDVKNITQLIYDEINKNIDKLLTTGELTIQDLLHDNYTDIIFINDIIKIKLGSRDYGELTTCEIKNNVILINVLIEYKLTHKDILNKKLNEKIKYTINHEFNHVIERYYSDELSNSWNISKNIDLLRLRYNPYKTKIENFDKYDMIDDILHFLYLSQPHELRARLSSLYEELKNKDLKFEEYENYIKNTDIYKELENICLIDPNFLIKKIDSDILKDIMKRLFNITKNCEKEFVKYFNRLKINNKTYLEKMLKSYYFIFENPLSRDEFDRKIDFNKYIK